METPQSVVLIEFYKHSPPWLDCSRNLTFSFSALYLMWSFWYSSCQSTSSVLLLGEWARWPEFADGEGVWQRFREAGLQSRLGEVVRRRLREDDSFSRLGDDEGVWWELIDDGIRATLAADEGKWLGMVDGKYSGLAGDNSWSELAGSNGVWRG